MFLDNIKKTLKSFPNNFDMVMFNAVLIKTLEDSKDILILGNQIDIKNNNGEEVDVENIIKIVREQKLEIAFLSNNKIYAINVMGNPYKLIEYALSSLYTQNAVIFNGQNKNHGLLNIIVTIINALLKEIYNIEHLIEYINDQGFKEVINNEDVIEL
ncbi:MAG: hypothetical protein PHU94_00470 [Bacilli bacterium]|nr:hypothetical protein [Bacilli bacterium]MDD4733282.1 hypothetical protein [Bacilli bacterium]